MEPTLKNYVRFLYNIATSPISCKDQEISDRNSPVNAPEECYGYNFFDRWEVVAPDGSF